MYVCIYVCMYLCMYGDLEYQLPREIRAEPVQGYCSSILWDRYHVPRLVLEILHFFSSSFKFTSPRTKDFQVVLLRDPKSKSTRLSIVEYVRLQV